MRSPSITKFINDNDNKLNYPKHRNDPLLPDHLPLPLLLQQRAFAQLLQTAIHLILDVLLHLLVHGKPLVGHVLQVLRGSRIGLQECNQIVHVDYKQFRRLHNHSRVVPFVQHRQAKAEHIAVLQVAQLVQALAQNRYRPGGDEVDDIDGLVLLEDDVAGRESLRPHHRDECRDLALGQVLEYVGLLQEFSGRE